MSNWDVTLDGNNFMLVPGSYRASGSRPGASQASRQRLTDFTAGISGPKTGDDGSRGRRGGLFGTSAEGGWPAPWPVGIGGIGPGPGRQVASGSVGSASPKLTAGNDEYLYVAAGASLHRWSGGGSPVSRSSLPAAAVDMVRKGNHLFFAYDGAADVSRWEDGTGTATTSVLGSGERARRIGATGDLLVTSDADEPHVIQVWDGALSSSTSFSLAGDVRRMAGYGTALVVATDQDLYRVRGVDASDFAVERWGVVSDGLQAGDDYAWMTVFQGRLMAWIGGRVMAFDATDGVWQPTGMQGAGSSGAAVVAGWLMVSVQPHGGGSARLWGYDGSGWWLLDSGAYYPASAGDGKLATFGSSGGTLSYYELEELNDQDAIVPSFQIETPLLDAGEPDRVKDWSELGVELARPDGLTVGSWDYELEYSTDGGLTWSTAAAETVNEQIASVAGSVSVSATYLRLRVTAAQQSGLPPFIVAIRADATVQDSAGTSGARRRWEFQIHAREGGINRASAADPRSGQQIRMALWSLFESGGLLQFRDVDYNETSIEHTVRIAGLKESWRQPADQPALGADTLLDVTLEEA